MWFFSSVLPQLCTSLSPHEEGCPCISIPFCRECFTALWRVLHGGITEHIPTHPSWRPAHWHMMHTSLCTTSIPSSSTHESCSELGMVFSDWLPNWVVSHLLLGSSARWPHTPWALPVSRHCRWASSTLLGRGDKLKTEISGSDNDVSQPSKCLPWDQQNWDGEAKVVDSHEAARRDSQAECMTPTQYVDCSSYS